MSQNHDSWCFCIWMFKFRICYILILFEVTCMLNLNYLTQAQVKPTVTLSILLAEYGSRLIMSGMEVKLPLGMVQCISGHSFGYVPFHTVLSNHFNPTIQPSLENGQPSFWHLDSLPGLWQNPPTPITGGAVQLPGVRLQAHHGGCCFSNIGYLVP